MAPDLTLPQLRQRWTDNETPQSAAAALALWRGDVTLPAVVGDAHEHLQQATAHLTAGMNVLLSPTSRTGPRENVRRPPRPRR